MNLPHDFEPFRLIPLVHAAWVADMMKELLNKDRDRVRQSTLTIITGC